MCLAAILLAPGLATLWTAWSKFNVPVPPAPVALTLTGAGALAVNLFCAFLLAKHRHSGGSLTRAAFLSARNDAFANLAIIGRSEESRVGKEFVRTFRSRLPPYHSNKKISKQ